MTLPTSVCDPEWHARWGGCFQCCDACNYCTHRCHFCGEELTHGDRDFGTGLKHTCYVECRTCTHIGHEHGAPGQKCWGGEYTDCTCTNFIPNFKTEEG